LLSIVIPELLEVGVDPCSNDGCHHLVLESNLPCWAKGPTLKASIDNGCERTLT
jgi:hypothetical protein